MNLLTRRFRAKRERATAEARGPRRRSADRMRLVLDIARLLAVTDLGELLDRIAQGAAALLDAEAVRLLLYDPATMELWSQAASGEGLRIPAGAGIMGRVLQTGQTLELGAGEDDPAASLIAGGATPRNLLCAPLRDLDGQRIGVIVAVNTKSGRFSRADWISIGLLSEHAALAVQRFRLLVAATQGAELRREMDLARDVQGSSLPRESPRVPGLDVVGWTQAASITGGDAFDLWTLPDGRLGVFVGDASGHGLPAALIVSQTRAMLRALSDINPEPVWLLERLNARLAADFTDGRFVTAFVACVSGDGALEWASAGQGPIHIRARGGEPFVAYSASAAPLGVLPDFTPDRPPPVRLEPGGALVVMTDGVFEAQNQAGERFGLARVDELLAQAQAIPSEALVQFLRDTVRLWQARDEPSDDQTIVVVQRTE